jgi:hypothetical protein
MKFASIAGCLLLALPMVCMADTVWITGNANGVMQGAGCGSSPCLGWDEVAPDGAWKYGVSTEPGYVKFAPWGGFSGTVGGGAFDLGAIQFQNARSWGQGGSPQDDPSSNYYATLAGVVTISNGQVVHFSYQLTLDTVRNGTDTLSGLPSAPLALPFTVGGNTYDLNLLGFYQGSTRVTSITSGEWEFQSAALRANVTEHVAPAPQSDSAGSAVPEPATWLLLPAGAGAILLLRRRRVRA